MDLMFPSPDRDTHTFICVCYLNSFREDEEGCEDEEESIDESCQNLCSHITETQKKQCENKGLSVNNRSGTRSGSRSERVGFSSTTRHNHISNFIYTCSALFFEKMARRFLF